MFISLKLALLSLRKLKIENLQTMHSFKCYNIDCYSPTVVVLFINCYFGAFVFFALWFLALWENILALLLLLFRRSRFCPPTQTPPAEPRFVKS